MQNSKLLNFLSGTKILEELESPINGKITVVRDFAWGTHIQVAGLTQSGGILKNVWQSTLKKIRRKKIKNVLILGLGGGSLSHVISGFWPKAKITGVDLDSVMVELGKKYLGFNQNVKILIKDAYEFTSSCRLPAKSYDLICVDLYIGDKYPQKFETDQFLANLQKALNKNGVVIFNRLYYGDKRPQAEKFEKRLTKFFPKINRFFPEANIMFFCSWL